MFKRYLSLDIGDVRIGVAKSDIMGMIATPVEVIDRRKTKAIKRIEKLCEEYSTKTIVVGIPKSLDGTEKRQAEKVREFLEKLKKKIPEIELIEIDERLSTVSADKILENNGVKGAINKRKTVDQVAAAIILQGFLDRKK